MHLKRVPITLSVALGLCFSSTLVLADEKQIQETGKSPVEIDFPSGGELRLNLCPSGVVLQGADQNKVRVSFEAERSSNPSHVRVDVRASGNSGRVEVRECPRNNFHITVEIPKKSGLYVRMLAGKLEIRGIKGDKDIELSFGQMNITIGKASDYAHADASVNSGQVEAPAFSVSKGGLFRSFSKEGPGHYRLHAHVGAGQVTLLDSEN